MKIDKVKAKAFGPFRDAVLELAPGMTVVHGPNESGKSSWCAAMYAAVCGLRRMKGRGTAKDVDFKKRHQPWSGRDWQVSAEIRLDDGRELELEHKLGSGGTSSATNKATQAPLTPKLENDGNVDASILLGLDRNVVPAILFVRQAEILRVLEESGGLQQYLEKAAASVAVDSTAEEALERIESFQKESVGLDRRGSRRPLALTKERVEETREARGSVYDAYDAYGHCLTSRRDAEIKLGSLGAELEEVRSHEDQRLRLKKWAAFETTVERVVRARGLSNQIASGPQDDGSSPELRRAVGSVLGAFENRPPPSQELDGHSAEFLTREIESLPTVPVGDLRPHADVTEAHDRWRSAIARESTSKEAEPALGPAPRLALELPEIRRLADDLDRAVPGVDEASSAEIARLQAQLDAKRESARASSSSSQSMRRALLALGGALGLGAVTSAVLGQFLVAAGLAVVAVLLIVLGLRASGAIKEPGGAAGARDAEEGELLRLKARHDLEVETVEEAQKAREATKERLAAAGLPVDAAALRKLATEVEYRDQNEETHRSWKQRHTEIQKEVSEAIHSLTEALKRRNARVGGTSPEEDVQTYLNDCMARDTQNQKAARRADLEAQLKVRRAAEASQREERQNREHLEEQLRGVATEVACNTESVAETIAKLRSWMIEEEKRLALRRERDENRARLEQVLDGLSIPELEQEVEAARAKLPEKPEGGSEASLQDRSHELEALEEHARALRNDVSRLTGEVVSLEKNLGSLPEAIEDEVRAEDDYLQVLSLSNALHRATELLTAAKEKAHANIAPVIDAMLVPWVRKITNGRYDDVHVDPRTLSLEVHERGKLRDTRYLSHGTTEQIFLLLRVALSKLLVTTAETAPLIFDDVFVQSDATRTTALLELMHELSRERQIVVFSQEEEVLLWARRQLSQASDRIVTLNPPG